MNLDDAIHGRRSVRKYSSKKPDWRDILEAIDSARYAPMAGNNFSLKFILVNEKDKIQKIADASSQSFIATADYVVVACSDPKKTTNLFEKQAEVYLRQQAGAAIQNFLLKIFELGLSTCWVGHFYEKKIKDTLKISSDVQVEAIFPIGYPMEKVSKKKKPLGNVLFFNQYKNKKMNKIKKFW